MFALPQTVGYAIRALCCLEPASGQRRTAREVAACTDVPLAYLSKILRDLVEAGLVDGQRGHYGGFHLARPPQQLTLAQIIAAVDPNLRVDDCFLGVNPCEGDEPCPLHFFWEPRRKQIERKLATTRLSQIAPFYRKRMSCACSNEATSPLPASTESHGRKSENLRPGATLCP